MKKSSFFLFTILLFLSIKIYGQITNSVTYDFTDGTIISAQQSVDGNLTLGGAYIYHGTSYGLNLKVNQQINIAVDGSCTIRFLGSQYSGLNMVGTASTAGDLGEQVTKVVNDKVDTYDFVYSGLATTLNFVTVAGTGGDVYLPSIEVIPVQAGKDFTSAEKNIAYYFDLRDSSIVPSSPPNNIEVGLFKIDAGCCNGLGLNGTQHGITFKDGNKIALKVAGNSYIRVGADQYSSGTINLSSSTGAFDVVSQSNNTGATYSNGNPLYVDFLYVGSAGTVFLDHTGGGTAYLPYIEISPNPYNVSLSSYVQKTGVVTLNGVDITLTSGATSSDNATITVSNGIVLSALKDTGFVALDLGGNDLSTLTPTVSGDIASAVINGENLEITYADAATDPKTFTIKLYDNSYLHNISTYDFRDGTIITNGQSGDGLLTLAGNYSLHSANYGLDMKVNSQINLQVNGSSAVRFLGSQYSGLDMEGTQTTTGDLGTVSTKVLTDLVDTYELVYSEPRKTGAVGLQFKAVAATGNDIYLPKLDVIPAQMGAAYSNAVKNVPYFFDFRDGSIIPTLTNGQSGITKGLVEVVVGSSNAYGYNGTQHGSILKTGNKIILQVAGNSYIKIGGSQYSNGTISVSSASGSFDVLSQSSTTTGNFGNNGDTIDFLYAGTAGTVTLDFTSTVYVPYIEVSPIPYDVNLTPWTQKSGTITINGTQINFTAGADISSNASVTVSAGTVISATNESASLQIDLGGNALSSFTPVLTGDIASVDIVGNVLTINFSNTASDPQSYTLNITDNSAAIEAQPGVTYTYNFYDGSELPQTGYTTLRYDTFPTSDGIVTINSNTTTEALKFGYHDAAHGGVFFPGNSFDIIVAGNAIVTFIVDTYGVATDAVFEFTDENNVVLGSIPAQNIGGADGFPVNFSYTGSAGTITATLKSTGFPNAEIYLHGMSIENAATIVASNGKIDVWDFGAEQLDVNSYNNQLNETKINAWYSSTITPGTSGHVLPSFTEGVLSWVGGSNDRLRTSNTNLTRYDQNLGGATGFTGRVYQNGTTTGRYMSLTLSEDDEVTVNMLTQSGTGQIHFEYVANPSAQDDVVAVGSTLTELKFVAKYAGAYHIYDASDKPSYYRIERKDAVYKTLTGNVDVTQASGIPNGYLIVFTNEAGKAWTTSVSGGTYSIDLPQGYTYEISLDNANGYIISNGTSLDITDATTTHDITIQAVELYTVSGSITGLGSEISNLTLSYTPTASRVFVPQPIIDAGAATYTVQLEPNIEYTISASGVNDFEIVANSITIGTANVSQDVVFSAKPLYNVAINSSDLDATQLSKLQLTFSNLNDPGYNYTFSDISTVALRDGIYTIDYNGLDEYPVELALTSNLEVAGANTSKTLSFNPVTNWSFDDKVISNGTPYYKGLAFTGSVANEIAKGHLNCGVGSTVAVPLNPGQKMIITYYYAANFSIDGGADIITTSGSTSNFETVEYIYQGTSPGTATITVAGSGTTYLTDIDIRPIVAYTPIITVGTGKDYQTINEALNAIAEMNRPNDERVTVMIDPGNYEEMLVIKSVNVTLKNAAATPSIALLNKGVDIDANAVRVTSYYGYGYNYFSQGTDNKWNADVLAVNKANGYQNYNNVSGTTNASYWNATIVVIANGFEAEDLIIENSFNQYISLKESQDVVVATGQAPTGGTRPTTYGNTSVQNRGLGFVERAAAIGIANNTDKVILNKCRIVGRQDSFYGGVGARVVVYKGAMMGAVDYIFGGMNAVFYQTDFVLNTSDSSSDAAYITAAQQSSGRGYLMYECHVKSTVPGVETASTYGSKPGYFGRPWLANTSEVVFYNTTIDESTYPGSEGLSLISPVGWTSSLGGESTKMYEFGTTELASGIDNSGSRASWSTVLSSPTLTDGTSITTLNFTKGNDGWDPIPNLISKELSVNDFKIPSNSVKVKAYKGNVYISNVTSKTKIDIYSITGALVKSLQTLKDTSFNFSSGIWIVNVQDAEGVKTVKLIAH